MRLELDPNFPRPEAPDAYKTLTIILKRFLGAVITQVNALTEGRISAVTNATTALPTTGRYSQGDFVKNSQPTELGGAGSKYIIHGWECVVSGTPGTWVQCRFLTGN